MTTPESLAEKIADKAAETLSPVELEMKMRKWPPEFRVILWEAIAHRAKLLADEQRTP